MNSQEAGAGDRSPPFERYLIPLLIGFGPALILALTWDPSGVTSFQGRAIREYAFPILAVEGIVIGLSLSSGLFRWLTVSRVPRAVLFSLVIWLVVAWSTALLVAPFPRFSVFMTTLWIVHGLFGLSLAHLAATGKLEPTALIRTLLAGFILYALLMAGFAFQVEDPARFDWLRRLPGLGQLRRSGIYATAIIGLCIGCLSLKRRGLVLPSIAICAGFFLVFWSGSRGPIPAVLATLAASWILFSRFRRRSMIIISAVAAVAGLALAIAFPIPMGEFEPSRIVANQTASGRTQIWLWVSQEILKEPWFGHGEGQTAFVLRRNFVANPHNLILQTLFAWGIVGTACVAIIGAWIAHFIIIETRESNGQILPFVCGAMALLAQSMVDGTIYDVASTSIFAACLGTASGLALRRREQDDRISATSEARRES